MFDEVSLNCSIFDQNSLNCVIFDEISLNVFLAEISLNSTFFAEISPNFAIFDEISLNLHDLSQSFPQLSDFRLDFSKFLWFPTSSFENIQFSNTFSPKMVISSEFHLRSREFLSLFAIEAANFYWFVPVFEKKITINRPNYTAFSHYDSGYRKVSVNDEGFGHTFTTLPWTRSTLPCGIRLNCNPIYFHRFHLVVNGQT